MATIDGRYITVETEDPSYPIEVTEQPVERGVNLIDHIQKQPRTMGISGLVAGPEAAQIKAYLTAANDSGTIVQYLGRNAFKGIVTDFSTSHSYEIANGYTFSLTLREIRIASSTPVSKLAAPIRSQAAPVISSGTKQTQSNKKNSSQTKTKTKGMANKDEKKIEKVKFKAGSPWS